MATQRWCPIWSENLTIFMQRFSSLLSVILLCEEGLELRVSDKTKMKNETSSYQAFILYTVGVRMSNNGPWILIMWEVLNWSASKKEIHISYYLNSPTVVHPIIQYFFGWLRWPLTRSSSFISHHYIGWNIIEHFTTFILKSLPQYPFWAPETRHQTPDDD